MLFSSPIFLFAFLPVTLGLYYLSGKRYRNVILLVMSVLFYAWGEPDFILILGVSVCANHYFGLLAEKYRGTSSGKAVIVLDVLWNTGIFFIFKYLDFTLRNINAVTGADLTLPGIALPIGLSFFTFQAMSYVFDVYRGKRSQRNILDTALYIMFFPQLIAGPIVRYETVAEQINDRRENTDDFIYGIRRFTIGLAKKVILSNSCAVVADIGFDGDASALPAWLAWLAALSYSLQIYFDFSGYSDMAIGLGRLFGFHFNENFDHPSCAKSVSEFWRRWHISLGTWFRDYVYFPLGGSRVSSKLRLVMNLFVVWMLTGIWHGASWNFVAWGLMYFVLITFEKLTGISKGTKRIPSVFCRIPTLLFVLLGWVLFRANGLHNAMDFFVSMAGRTSGTVEMFTMHKIIEHIPYIILSL
ncbi:MAG: MBOAT family protein, partial [Oscillospiraceae bacterium]|nr:MBOAT family protein [Oscillospiraceae bacterium]